MGCCCSGCRLEEIAIAPNHPFLFLRKSPLYPQKRTFALQQPMSALGQKRTSRAKHHPSSVGARSAKYSRITSRTDGGVFGLPRMRLVVPEFKRPSLCFSRTMVHAVDR